MQATTRHKLTLADRHGLAAALCNAWMDDEEKRALDRILYGVRRGHIRMVDDLFCVDVTSGKAVERVISPKSF